MKKTLTTGILTLLLTGATALAAPLSPGQALNLAREFENKATAKKIMRAPSKSNSIVHAYKHTDTESGLDAVYVFNRGMDDGYIMVSGDDLAPMILGYSDHGHFNGACIPDNMKVMLDNWGAQIAWLSSHKNARAVNPKKVPTAVEPLLGDIAWDQGSPYNRKCPTVTQADAWGSSSGKGPAATGCVATALGQIMYYHQWPPVGHGSISYVSVGETPDGDTERVNVSATFEGYNYDWSAMLPSLNSSSSSEAIEAVSTLLFHVGASFESIYGASTGATDVSVAPALMKYFDYDKGINYLKRDFFTTEEWDEILQTELREKRPVAYGGVTRRGEGHFFVLDGVNEEGYYHVNWGWSGMENGYYLLTLLEPGAQGIGGADGGAFHYAQNMIVGIQKPREGSQLNYNFTCEGLTAVDKTIGRQETVKLTASEIWNDSPNEVTANLGFILVDQEGKTVYRQMVTNATKYGIAYGESKISSSFLIPDNIQNGEYTLIPAYQIDIDDYTTDYPMQVKPGRISRLNVTITENNITYASKGAYSLSLVQVKGDNEGDLENGVTKKITLTIHNDGDEFYGPVQLRMFINGFERTFGRFDFPSSNKQANWVTVPANSDTDLTFEVGKFDLPGHDDYVVRLWGNEGTFDTDEDGYTFVRSAKNLCSIKGVKVIGPALPPVVEVVDDIIVTTAVNGVVPRNDVGMKVCITNDGGEWTGQMRCAVWDPEVWSRDPVGYVTFPNTVTIEGFSKEQWITLSGGEMPLACEEGHNYELTVYELESNEAMVPSYYVTTEITMGPAVEKNPVLSLDDMTFSVETVTAGIPTDIQFLVSNKGYAYSGEFFFTVNRENEVLHTSERRSGTIDRDDDSIIEFTETFELPTASDYTVVLYNEFNEEVGRRENISFIADDPVLRLTDETIIPSVINGDKPVDFIFGVENTGYRFDSTLHFVILLDDMEKYVSASKEFIIARGERGIITFNETVDLPSGDNYILRLLADDLIIGERTDISIENNNNSSINEISSDQIEVIINNAEIIVVGQNIRLDVFSADGRHVASSKSNILDISGLGSGSYILRVENVEVAKTFKFIK